MNQEQNQYNYEEYSDMNQTPDDHQDDKLANTLCIISLVCEIVPIIISGVLMYVLSEMTEGDTFAVADMVANVMGIFNILCAIAGLVLMIYVRVKYPKNIFGKVLMWLYIVVAVTALIAFIIYMVLILVACISCFSCIQSMG